MSERSANENILEISDLKVEYDTDDGVVKAVNDVSFVLKKGETLGLVGETGAGKTTIARSILRILPEPPAKIISGEIRFKGRDINTLSEREMRKIRGHEIAMVFQDPMTALNPVLSVGEQIAEAIRLHQNKSKAEAAKLAGDMLEMVGILRTRYSDYPHQFSGGMKQRVVIAIALSCNPELLLADEPTTALDVTIQAQVLALMKQLKTKFDSSMIIITHDFGVIAQTCDRVAVVYAGKIMEMGQKEHIFLNPKHPYTIGLFDSLPKMDMQEDRLHAIPGMMPNPMNLPQGCPFWPRCSYAQEECKSGSIPAKEIESGHLVYCLREEETE